MLSFADSLDSSDFGAESTDCGTAAPSPPAGAAESVEAVSCDVLTPISRTLIAANPRKHAAATATTLHIVFLLLRFEAFISTTLPVSSFVKASSAS